MTLLLSHASPTANETSLVIRMSSLDFSPYDPSRTDVVFEAATYTSKIETDNINPEFVDGLYWIGDVANGLGHFPLIDSPVRMGKKLMR